MNTKFECVGVDVFLRMSHYDSNTPTKFQNISFFELKALSNRGTRVWPGDRPAFELTDIFRARFLPKTSQSVVTQEQIVQLLTDLNKLGAEWVHLEKLHRLGDKNVFSEMQ